MSLIQEIEVFQETEKRKVPEKPVNIICVHCKGKVGFVLPSELKLPLRGDMIYPHTGCENWPLPMHHAGPLEFVCPHAWGEGYDQHLFINVIEGSADKSDWFLTEDHTPYRVEYRPCKCGCGGNVEPGNKFANGLTCHHRYKKTQTG